ncbi:heavy-metal-associated domain-containing protein [Eubacteriales bacterium OttesenSCG-928-G02]|nr:heavy-metal-associated domain-containing protein [Eubacteriales bacterium OttesenSCG-928-G02]
MKKIIKVENLNCGSCAAKIEEAISKLSEIESVKVNFMMQKITFITEESDVDKIIEKIKQISVKIEPDMKLII